MFLDKPAKHAGDGPQNFWSSEVCLAHPRHAFMLSPILSRNKSIIENEIELIPIRMDDLKMVATLPLHHRDPFDRLLIAQAMVQEITIASDDSSFVQYDVKLFW